MLCSFFLSLFAVVYIVRRCRSIVFLCFLCLLTSCAGADINLSNRNASPLHIAVFRGLYELVEILLDRGAALDQKTGIALSLYFVFLISAAFVVGVGFIAVSDRGTARTVTQLTPLHVAAMLNEVKIVMALVQAGATMTTHNAFGETPLVPSSISLIWWWCDVCTFSLCSELSFFFVHFKCCTVRALACISPCPSALLTDVDSSFSFVCL